MSRIPFYDLNQIGDEVVAAFQFDVHLRPTLPHALAKVYRLL